MSEAPKPKLDIRELLEELSLADLMVAPETVQTTLRNWWTPSGMVARLLIKSARKAMKKKKRTALLYASFYGIIEAFGIVAPLKLAVHLMIEDKKRKGKQHAGTDA